MVAFLVLLVATAASLNNNTFVPFLKFALVAQVLTTKRFNFFVPELRKFYVLFIRFVDKTGGITISASTIINVFSSKACRMTKTNSFINIDCDFEGATLK